MCVFCLHTRLYNTYLPSAQGIQKGKVGFPELELWMFVKPYEDRET